MDVVLEPIITPPACDFHSQETVPTDATVVCWEGYLVQGLEMVQARRLLRLLFL